MPSVYDIKPRFQALLRPSMEQLHARGITPNQLTAGALVGSAIIGVAVSMAERWLFLLLPLWMFARMALNALDGMMAREKDQKTQFGAVLNEVSDVVSDWTLYLPLGLAVHDASWAILAFSLGAALTEFCGVLVQALGGQRQYRGPMGKSDRALFVGTLAFFTAFYPELLAIWPWLFWLATALTLYTSWNRARESWEPAYV